MIKGVLFDLWNTLAYLEGRKDQEPEIQEMLGDKYPRYHKSFVSWHETTESEDDFLARIQQELELDASIIARLEEMYHVHHHLYPETLEVLQELKSKGLMLGLISNSPLTSKERVRELGVEKYFDVMIWSFEHGLRKPNPELFKKGVDALGVRPEDALFVGDSFEKDVKGAEAAGMRGIQIDRNENPQDRSMQNLREILSILA
jgi:putative hydrolase of the HAD superfamily